MISHFIPNNGIGGLQSFVNSLASCRDNIFYFKRKKKISNETKNEFYFFSFKTLYLIYKSNIFHTHGYTLTYIFWLSIIFNKPIYHTIHNEINMESGPKRRYLYNFYNKIKKINFIVISNNFVDDFIQCYPNAKYRVIHNGTNKPLNPVQKKIYQKRTKILFAGRFDYQKNVERFIKIFKFQTNYEIYIIGELENYNYSNFINDLPSNFSYLGSIQNLSNQLNNYDIVVSTSRFEGLPILMLECILLGIPYVSTCVGGVDEFINKDYIFETDKECLDIIESIKTKNFVTTDFYIKNKYYCSMRRVREDYRLYYEDSMCTDY